MNNIERVKLGTILRTKFTNKLIVIVGRMIDHNQPIFYPDGMTCWKFDRIVKRAEEEYPLMKASNPLANISPYVNGINVESKMFDELYEIVCE